MDSHHYKSIHQGNIMAELSEILGELAKRSIVSILIILPIYSQQTNATGTDAIYPKFKNNGMTWYKPSSSFKSYYADYFVAMDKTYKQRVISDRRFSYSLLNLCGEKSALFYRYLKNKPEKTLYGGNHIINDDFSKKEGLPFITETSQYYENDMIIEYPIPSKNGKYSGKFIYQYNSHAGKESIRQLDKNLGNGNGFNNELVFSSFLSIYYIDDNGHKANLANESPFYLTLKIDQLKDINKASSEKDAFNMGKKSCYWMPIPLG